jgi:predicted RNA-binding protein with TRAM domain
MKKNTGFLKATAKAAWLLACGLVASVSLSLAGCVGTGGIPMPIYTGSPIETGVETKIPGNAIQLTEDRWIDGAVSSTSGEQWFKFTASANTQYLHVLFGTLSYLYVQLHDSKGNVLGNPTELRGSTTYTTLTVTSGQVYYVKVTPYGSNGGTYRIGFNTMPLAPGILSAAATLSPDTWADGVLTPANGEQWFTFTASANTQYLHVLFGTLTDLYVQLHDSNGNVLGNPTELRGSTTYTTLTVTSGQVYYVKVTPYGSGTYRIGFNTMPLAPGILSAAATLSPDTWADGVLTPTNGEQWFTFTASAGTQYLHVFFGTLTDLNVQLYDSNGNALGNAVQLQGRTTSRSLMVTSGQVYYVRITPYWSNSGTYRIAFNTSDTAPATD